MDLAPNLASYFPVQKSVLDTGLPVSNGKTVRRCLDFRFSPHHLVVARAIASKLFAITPKPTHRSMPALPL